MASEAALSPNETNKRSSDGELIGDQKHVVASISR